MVETRVLLLRHAETSAPDRFHGAESDVGLSERGKVQAQRVARALQEYRPTILVSSAMRRAVETAAPIAHACGLIPRTIDTLHERRMGPLSGQLLVDGLETYHHAKQRWEAGDLHWSHEGGESYAKIRDRVVPVWDALAASAPGETIVVVAHGVVIRVLLTSLVQGFSHADFSRFGTDHVALNDLRWDGSRWLGAALNWKVVELDV